MRLIAPVLLTLGVGTGAVAWVLPPTTQHRQHTCSTRGVVSRRRPICGRVRPSQYMSLSAVQSTQPSGAGAEGERRSLLDSVLRRLRPLSGVPRLLSQLRPGMYDHDSEIMKIAGPALLALLADPFLTIVDSAYVGRLGPSTLAALGPCTSLFHLSFNGFRAFALSTTALVSSALAVRDKRRVRQVVLQAMALAVGVGTLVAWGLRSQGAAALAFMGAVPGSELCRVGLPYLRIRALAAPVVLLLMVCEGTFRGAGDTLTPLPVTGAIALINLILDPLLMFKYNMGMAGAAVATVVAQYIGAALYLALLFGGGARSPLHIPDSEEQAGQEGGIKGQQGSGKVMGLWGHVVAALPVFGQLLAANGAMVVRNGTLLATWALATATATRMGMMQVAAHQVVLSVWLFGALICESPGIAAQVLSARYQSLGRRDLLRSLAHRLLQLGSVLGLGIGVALASSRSFLPRLFASHPDVLSYVRRLLLVASVQMPLVALVLVFEGFLVGCGRFSFLARSSTLSSGLISLLLLSLPRIPQADVVSVWLSIKAMFVLRLVAVLYALLDKRRSPLYIDIHSPPGHEEERPKSPSMT